jgi:hypothetical protein
LYPAITQAGDSVQQGVQGKLDLLHNGTLRCVCDGQLCKARQTGWHLHSTAMP